MGISATAYSTCTAKAFTLSLGFGLVFGKYLNHDCGFQACHHSISSARCTSHCIADVLLLDAAH